MLLLLLFIVRDILRENLKDLRNSLAQAEMQFRSHFEQADIFRELHQEDQNKPGPEFHFHTNPSSPSEIESVQQARSSYGWRREIEQADKRIKLAEEDFDSVSELLDALPSGGRPT